MFPWYWHAGLGAFAATIFWLVVFLVVGTWAGWPRAREREAWRAAKEAEERYDTLCRVVSRAVYRFDAEYAAQDPPDDN